MGGGFLGTILCHLIDDFGWTFILEKIVLDFFSCLVVIPSLSAYMFDLIISLIHVCRYNIPELAKKCKVYAIDLLGFGWSDKALIEYEAMVWRDQVVDFLKEIVKEPAVVVGNR